MLSSCKAPRQLYGYWEVSKVEYKLGHFKEKPEKWVAFLKGGTLEGGKLGQAFGKKGTWSYDKKKKSLTFITTDGSRKDEVYLIKSLSKSALIMTKDSSYIYLEKLPKKK